VEVVIAMMPDEAAKVLCEALKSLGVAAPERDAGLWLDGDDFERVKRSVGASLETVPYMVKNRRYEWMRIGGLPVVNHWSASAKDAA
jgi:hypothetical protein